MMCDKIRENTGVNDHAFVDGNKRVDILAALMTLKWNDAALQYMQIESIKLGSRIAWDTKGYEGILGWIRAHEKR